jgi:hypothetical protein
MDKKTTTKDDNFFFFFFFFLRMNDWLWIDCSLRGQKKQKGVARSAALHSDEQSKAKQAKSLNT